MYPPTKINKSTASSHLKNLGATARNIINTINAKMICIFSFFDIEIKTPQLNVDDKSLLKYQVREDISFE